MGPLLLASLLLSLAGISLAADCKIATVGSPYSTCYDIAAAAKISVDQLTSYNSGLNCGTLVPGQRLCISTGTLPDNTPKPNPDGSCASYKPVTGDYCALIATKYGITTAQIEQFNKNTYKWKGCAALNVGMPICVGPGTPPPIPVNTSLQCGPESPKNATCPLKACCSAFGFCGLTDEFCKPAANGDPCISNCGQPTIKTCGGGQLTRKIGYYAGWAARRKCQAFRPTDIDLTGYTDVIFSFAVITQDMQLGIDVADSAALKELVGLKYNYPNMKVRIAVGGWTFSTSDPTKSLFTVMIESSSNRKKFIDSSKAFINLYGLDGIDIDMEYPGAMERSAPATDTPNLTALFKEMRASMGNMVISVAAPAGYWFLKGFEIDKIMQDISYINMMSYDYHGPWDTAVAGEDGTAKPHTSIKDIEDSVKLYTRAGVDLSKVNLGLAWYGRTYNVGSCKGTGCKMSGGGVAGSCTGESGVVSQLEIWNDNPKPTLDTNTQTYWYNKGNDFITYDDQTTWAYKTDYAAKHCFGGTFVWSLDQVRPTNKPPPPPPVDVECGPWAIESGIINDCRTLVNKINDNDSYNMSATQCNGIIGIRPTCEGDCCLFVTFDDFQVANIRAKEVKAAASAILNECYSGKQRRNVERRFLPVILAIAAAWNMVAAVEIFGVVIGAFASALAAIFKLVLNDDDERRAFVIKTLDEAQKAAPEYNIIIVHTDHIYEFDDLHQHQHVEFDRPAPWGTFGYEIYYARTGTFELLGDGDYINWAWSGYITPDKDNSKKLTLGAPGLNYGVASIDGQYTTPNGATTKISMGVGLGNHSACISCFV